MKYNVFCPDNTRHAEIEILLSEGNQRDKGSIHLRNSRGRRGVSRDREGREGDGGVSGMGRRPD